MFMQMSCPLGTALVLDITTGNCQVLRSRTYQVYHQLIDWLLLVSNYNGQVQIVKIMIRKCPLSSSPTGLVQLSISTWSDSFLTRQIAFGNKSHTKKVDT